jgi:hypothetical protein
MQVRKCSPFNPGIALTPRYRVVEAYSCYSCGMSRVRVSTTVDGDLLAEARRIRIHINDSVLMDEALRSLITSNRSGEIDASYVAYDQFPIDEPDDWGSLDAFRNAAAAS